MLQYNLYLILSILSLNYLISKWLRHKEREIGARWKQLGGEARSSGISLEDSRMQHLCGENSGLGWDTEWWAHPIEQALVKESIRHQRFWEVMQVQERPQGSKKAPGRAEVGRQQWGFTQVKWGLRDTEKGAWWEGIWLQESHFLCYL